MGLAYRHADWLILRQVDHYLDLTGPQKESLGRNLAPMLARHRTEALPAYEAFLHDIHLRVSRGLTREDLDWVFSRYDSLRADLVEQLIGNGAMVLTSVDDRQIEHLQQVMQKDSQKADRLLRQGKEVRLTKRAGDTVEFVEEWLGPLTADQRARISAMSLALPDLRGPWHEYQQQAQQDLIEALRTRASADVVAARLRAWFLFPELHAPPAYRKSFETMRAGVKDMVVGIDRMTTPQQRTHVLNKLQALIDTIHDLRVS